MNSLDRFTPSVFDIAVTDILQNTLQTDISQQLNKQYLAPLKQHQQQSETIRTGIIYGASYRGFISIPTRFKDRKPIWIHYMIDTAAPKTFLIPQAKKALVGSETQLPNNLIVYINGLKIIVGTSSRRFSSVNILGMDFLMTQKQLKYEMAGMNKQTVIIEFQKY